MSLSRKLEIFIIILLPIFLLLSGCSNKRNALYYAKHPTELQLILSNCRMTNTVAMDNPECIKAINIYNKLLSYTNDIVSDPQEFGKKIIIEQSDMVNLSKKLALTKNEIERNRLREQYQTLNEDVKLRLFFAAKSEGM